MWLTARNTIIILSLICLVLLIIPINLRHGLPIDSESYKNIRLAEEIKQKGLISYDELSYGGRDYTGEQTWPTILSIKPELTAKYLPIILGLLSLIIF